MLKTEDFRDKEKITHSDLKLDTNPDLIFLGRDIPINPSRFKFRFGKSILCENKSQVIGFLNKLENDISPLLKGKNLLFLTVEDFNPETILFKKYSETEFQILIETPGNKIRPPIYLKGDDAKKYVSLYEYLNNEKIPYGSNMEGDFVDLIKKSIQSIRKN
jgi:hypothetical protein